MVSLLFVFICLRMLTFPFNVSQRQMGTWSLILSPPPACQTGNKAHPDGNSPRPDCFILPVSIFGRVALAGASLLPAPLPYLEWRERTDQSICYSCSLYRFLVGCTLPYSCISTILVSLGIDPHRCISIITNTLKSAPSASHFSC
jgi:hypothetical protein